MKAAHGHLLAFLAIVMFAMMSPCSKLVLEGGHINGFILAAFRICGAALLFWISSLFFPAQRIEKRDYKPLFLMSMAGMALNQTLFITGLQFTAPTNACTLTVITPVLTLVLSAIIFKERVGLRRGLGIVLAASGALVLILQSGTGGKLSGHPVGDLLCMASQTCSAFYFLFFSGIIKRYSPVTLMKWLFLISSFISLPLAAPSLVYVSWESMGLVEWWSLIYVVVGGTFISYGLMIMAQRVLLPSVVSSYCYVQPVVAAIAGVCWGLDVINWSKCLAVLLISLGVWWVSQRQREVVSDAELGEEGA